MNPSKHPGRELADIYADGGISGTNTKKREEVKHMIEDCTDGRIDMIIIKPIRVLRKIIWTA